MNVWSGDRERTQRSTPYPHIVIDDFLPESLVADFLGCVGDDESAFGHRGWGGHRSSAQFGTREYERLLHRHEPFREIHRILNSPAAVEGLHRWYARDLPGSGLKGRFQDASRIRYRSDKTEFGVTSSLARRAFIKYVNNPILRRYGLRRHVRAVRGAFSEPEMYPLISFSKSIGGYVEPPHTDSRHKIFVCLIYLDDVDEGGELQLKQLAQEKALAECPMYPAESALETVFSVKPKRNRCVIFLNQNNAYHGTTPFEGLRRFIYFAYAASHVESAFETNYTVVLGDVGRDGRI